MSEIFIANVYCFGMQKRTFAYKIPQTDCDKIGSIVKVSFGKKTLLGIILSIQQENVLMNEVKINNDNINIDKIKEINDILYPNLLSEKFLSFLQKMSWYNVIDLERILEIVIPSFWLNKKKEVKDLNDVLNRKNIKTNNKINLIHLNDEQNRVSNELLLDGFSVNLIRGSMGSGKTYIFLDAVRKKIFEDNSNQILIMVPEIALTNNLINIIYDFVGIEPVIWHSSVSQSKKKVYYENIITGKIKIVVSTRSGLLLPYKNLSLIVIDEEHDLSYKQDEAPCYHARDMAVLRAKYDNIPVILSSATPSIETLVNVIEKKYTLHTINTQFFNSTKPKIELIDTNISYRDDNEKKKIEAKPNEEDNKKNTKTYLKLLSRKALDSIITTLNKQEQTMIFINRRGYSRTLKCDDCGYEAKCKNCDNFLSYHSAKKMLKCHYCGYKIDDIKSCQNCGSFNLSPNKGIGVEQVEKEVLQFAKDNNIQLNTLLFSSDEISKESDIDKISTEIKNGNIDVIIGTQIMTKGHHFPRLTNIIVLDVDRVSLDGDFRAYERMFQMLFQLSGRAGRERKDSTIYIQTTNKDNIVLQAIKNYDLNGFYANEIKQRKQYNLPPYSRFIAIIISSENKELAYNTANDVYKELLKYLPKNVEILGPAESNLHFLKKQYRYRFLLKSQKTANLQQKLNDFRQRFKISKHVMLKFDVDCYNFL